MGEPYTSERNPAPISGTRQSEALGQSEAFLGFMERLSRAAVVDRPVLLIGERGTGKELAAARLHYLSKRWQGPFVTLSCAALSPSLIESELFGYEAGAFTGASRRRSGRFEAADDGTLFLDEIANIPIEVQEKILRVVEYGGFERVGGTQTVQVDVRILGATNVHLPAMVRAGQFKQDLLDRLSFEVLNLPPLRHREGDILLLANHFAARMAYELEWETVPEIDEAAMAELEAYGWPGNVRELKNVVERAVYRADGPVITEIVFNPFETLDSPDALPAESKESASPPDAVEIDEGPLTEAVRALEIRLIDQALKNTKYNQKEAAALLGLTYHQFRGLYRKYQADLQAT